AGDVAAAVHIEDDSPVQSRDGDPLPTDLSPHRLHADAPRAQPLQGVGSDEEPPRPARQALRIAAPARPAHEHAHGESAAARLPAGRHAQSGRPRTSGTASGTMTTSAAMAFT